EVLASVDIGDLDEWANIVQSSQLDDERRAQNAARVNARIALVALAVHVARVGLQDQATARSIAHGVAEFSKDRSACYAGSRFWRDTVEIFKVLENRSGSWRELWENAGAARARESTALQELYGIAATVVAGPREAAQILIQIVPWLEQMFSPTLYHATVTPFVREYWQWAFDQFPMSFGLLDRTRKTVAATLELDDKSAVRAVLRAVGFSLDIKMPDYLQKWLTEDPICGT
ncbi:MAG TPA: hypothetical protein VNH18_21030, partial [Bryobacteraceae bacterium]|nr:hypothetical protein [Bryobacteraceae bacterium]